MKRFAKYAFTFFLLLFLAGILHLNVTLYHRDAFEMRGEGNVNVDVLHQLNYLKKQLHQGAGKEMQNYFPEGFIFINVLYGLTWCETIASLNKEDLIFQEGMTEINWALAELSSNFGKRIFQEALQPTYGAFYQGWTNYLLGKKLALESPLSRDTTAVQKFKNNCQLLAQAFRNSESPYLPSYSGAAWPADNLVCMAALCLHDELYDPQYVSLKQEWLQKVKTRLDPQTGLIPHSVRAITGFPAESARGSSQSLMNIFLLEIEEDFAREQFDIYHAFFLNYRFGLPGIREYPKGFIGSGDVDSGPVVLQIGGAASIVGIRTMALYGDRLIWEGLRNSVEGFGVAIDRNNHKKYLFGRLPMADAFIAWANTALPIESNNSEKNNWRRQFQGTSLVLVLIFLVLLYWLWFKR